MPLKSSVFLVHFSNIFWHRNKTFPKGISWNEIVSLLVIFHLPYSKYRGVKFFFVPVVIKIKIFDSCHTRVVCVVLVFHSCRTGAARVTLVSLVSHSCLALVLRIRLDLLKAYKTSIKV